MAKQKKAAYTPPADEKVTPPPQPNPTNNNKTQVNINLAKIFAGREAYFLLGTLALCCFIVFKDFITGDKIYLYKDIGSDSINIEYPILAQVSDYIRNYGVPTWSFRQGMGQNIFPLWLGDIFSNILTLLADKEHIPYFLGLIEAIKVTLCGFVFFNYLNELRVSRFTSFICSILLGFCGFVIVGGGWTIFSTEALYAVVMLYGFERWLNKGKLPWLIAGTAAMAFLQPFLLFPYALFFAVYALVRYNDERGNEWNKFPVFLLKTIGVASLGVVISAYQLLPDILQYIESPRVGGEAELMTKLKANPAFEIANPLLRFTTTFRMFGSNMLGTGSEYKGWVNYLEAPLFYCGLLSLVAFPQAFVCMDKRQRIGWGLALVLFALPIFFPFFRYSFWAYSGDYFRTFSFVTVIVLMFLAARGIDGIIKGKISMPLLAITLVVYLVLLYTPSPDYAEYIDQGTRLAATSMLILYGALLWALTRPSQLKTLAMMLVVLLTITEAAFFSSATVNDRDTITGKELKERDGYNDYTLDAIKYIKQTDKGFYRISKSYTSGQAIHISFNDAKVQGFYGTMTYHSFNQINYVRFLGTMGVLDPKNEFQTRWVEGLNQRPFLMSLATCKYWLTKTPEPYLATFGYDSVAKCGDVCVFKNRFSVPLGVGYDKVMDERTFRQMGKEQKDHFLLEGFVADSVDAIAKVYTRFDLTDTSQPYSPERYAEVIKSLSRDSLTITSFKENHITGTTNFSSNKMLFLSIPYDQGWTAKVDGKPEPIHRINVGFTGIPLPPGKHTVDLKFTPRYMATGGMISLAGIGLCALLLVINKKSIH